MVTYLTFAWRPIDLNYWHWVSIRDSEASTRKESRKLARARCPDYKLKTILWSYT